MARRFRIELLETGPEPSPEHGEARVHAVLPDRRNALGPALPEILGELVRAGQGLERSSDELAAVEADVSRGVQAILAFLEEIDAAVHRLKLSGHVPDDAADQLSDRIVAALQACDFQDLTGQRITTVRRGLAELARKISIVSDIAPAPAAPARPMPLRLENGPRLQSDEGHLTQAEVDRLLA
jgi:chemotaxis protein CheZ